MTKMVKGSFIIRKTAKQTKEVEGYKFDLLLKDNTVKRMGVYSAGKEWVVTDLDTGLMLCSSTTRKDAVARAEGETMVAKFTELVNSDKYKSNLLDKPKAPTAAPKKPTKKAPKKEDNVNKVKELEDKVAELEKALAAAKAAENGWKAKAEEYYAAKKPAKAPAKKPPAKKATAKKAPAKPKAPKAPAKKPSNEVNLETLLGTMREWCKTHPNTAATRKPGNNSAVRVLGVERFDQKTQDELTELGFRWAGGPQCWMFGEQQAQKQGKTVIDGR